MDKKMFRLTPATEIVNYFNDREDEIFISLKFIENNIIKILKELNLKTLVLSTYPSQSGQKLGLIGTTYLSDMPEFLTMARIEEELIKSGYIISERVFVEHPVRTLVKFTMNLPVTAPQNSPNLPIKPLKKTAIEHYFGGKKFFRFLSDSEISEFESMINMLLNKQFVDKFNYIPQTSEYDIVELILYSVKVDNAPITKFLLSKTNFGRGNISFLINRAESFKSEDVLDVLHAFARKNNF